MLSEKQYEFLEKEFGLKKEEISELSVEEWKEIKFSCFMIEGDEAMDIPNDSAYSSERGETAASIVDFPYSELK